MSDAKSWVDRLFGTGVVWAVAGVVIGAIGLYRAHVGAGEESDKLRKEFKESAKADHDHLEELRTRMAKMEMEQAVAKAVAHGAAVQADVAQLQIRYNKPEEQALLRDLGTSFADRQKTWLKTLNQPSTATAELPAPPIPTLPNQFDFLSDKDKNQFGSLLKKTEKSWVPPPEIPALPKFDFERYQQRNLEDKSFAEKVGDTVKTYPWIAGLLLLIILGAVFNKK